MNTVEYYRNWRANRELTKLGLSERIVNALGSVGVTTYEQLLQVTVKELEKDVPNIARVSIKSILELVSSKGHKLVGQDEFFNKQNKSKREWVGLTDDERNAIGRHHAYVANIIEATEAKLKQKNGY